MNHSMFKQGSAPYKDHKAMQCDISHGSPGSSAGRSKVTEGREPPLNKGKGGGKKGKASYKPSKVK